MKKLTAVLMALTILFSFAMADTQTDLQPAPAAKPATATNLQPAVPEEELQVINFREMVDEETLAAGSYVQLGELPLQIWIPGDLFTAIYTDLDTFEALTQAATSSTLDTRTQLLEHLSALQSALAE